MCTHQHACLPAFVTLADVRISMRLGKLAIVESYAQAQYLMLKLTAHRAHACAQHNLACKYV